MLRRLNRICEINRFKSELFWNIRCFATNESITNNVEKKSKKQESRNHYDVVIIGGGMVGTTLASAIGKNDDLSYLSVLLLEASDKLGGFFNSNYSNRVSALNRSTVDLLNSIGVWNHITSARYKIVEKMQVWDAISDAYITFNQKDADDDLAYIVENDLIVDAVLKTMKNMSNINVNYASRIEKISSGTETTTTVTLKDGKTFSCNLLVGADGAKSFVRQHMNVNTFEMSYNQMGIVATLEVENSTDGNSTAWQRFLPTGPVALLPLTDNLSSLVWSTTPSEAKELLKITPEDFTDKLNEAFKRKMQSPFNIPFSTIEKTLNKCLLSTTMTEKYSPPKVLKVVGNSRAAFPLGLAHASSYVKTGIALVGDAAHRIHPLAGQGVNLGFGDVKCLTTILKDAVCNGASISDLGYLLKYEKNRLSHNVPIILGTHGLQKLYSTDLIPVVLMRSIGLQITNSIPSLKKFFIGHAMY